jgi:hypothetical protein
MLQYIFGERRRRLSRRLLMNASEIFLAAMVLLIVLPAFARHLFDTQVVQEVMDVLVVIASYVFLYRGIKQRWVHWVGGVSLVLATVVLLKPNDVLPILELVSEGVTTLLFISAVVHLFRMLFLTKQVNAQVIISSISGYFALGLFWALCAFALERVIPGSYEDSRGFDLDRLSMTYYGFMTMTTVGYGDIEPVLPPSRALSTLMAVSGQMYLAGVMAVLVGKFLEKGGRGRL